MKPVWQSGRVQFHWKSINWKLSKLVVTSMSIINILKISGCNKVERVE